MSEFITRFAPSPTGPLHLGHAYSALLAHDMAVKNGGDFLLRIEDIDRERAKPQWEDQIYQDLTWLGLCWPTPCLQQQSRQAAYDTALDKLWDMGLLYPCTCSRRDIQEALSAPQEGAPLMGPDGLVYPGTCQGFPAGFFPENHPRPRDTVLRLDMARATRESDLFKTRIEPGNPFASYGYFKETGEGPNGETGDVEFTPDDLIQRVGDVVLSRRGFGTSYHLSVVLDDAFQGVTHVVRGQDLFEATPIHILLQDLLGLPTPTYHHHHLIRDEHGKRLAKRDDARAIAKYRAEGATPADIRKMVCL